MSHWFNRVTQVPPREVGASALSPEQEYPQRRWKALAPPQAPPHTNTRASMGAPEHQATRVYPCLSQRWGLTLHCRSQLYSPELSALSGEAWIRKTGQIIPFPPPGADQSPFPTARHPWRYPRQLSGSLLPASGSKMHREGLSNRSRPPST